MVGRLVYFGEDTCHRLAVLKNAGYRVNVCKSIQELSNALRLQGRIDAVLLNNTDATAQQHIVALIRLCCSASVILFQDINLDSAKSHFDLIIPPLTAPPHWLQAIAELLKRTSADYEKSLPMVALLEG